MVKHSSKIVHHYQHHHHHHHHHHELMEAADPYKDRNYKKNVKESLSFNLIHQSLSTIDNFDSG